MKTFYAPKWADSRWFAARRGGGRFVIQLGPRQWMTPPGYVPVAVHPDAVTVRTPDGALVRYKARVVRL